MEIKLLSCPLCSKPHFQGVDSLRSSLISVATSHLACPICNESLLGLDKLTIHLFTHINDEQQQKALNENDSETTKQKTEEEINKRINNLERKNEEDDGNKDGSRVKCDICSFSFIDQTILDMHTKLLHQTIPDKQGLYNYHCHLCSKKFKKRGSLMVHLRVAHYGFSHSNDTVTITRSDLGIKTTTDIENDVNVDTTSNSSTSVNVVKGLDNKQWECDVCSKMFTTKYFLKKHKRLHTGEMPYFCNQCNKSFTFQQSYHKHMLYHSSDKPYVCNECGRAFKELSTLQNHARIHSGERPFGCETCGKRFRQRVSYLVHQRIHTGVMPYKCTACEKTFRYKVSQRSHKCPNNPPGSVVRIADIDSNKTVQQTNSMNPSGAMIEIAETNAIQHNGKFILSVDYTTGNINLIQNNQTEMLIPDEETKNNSLRSPQQQQQQQQNNSGTAIYIPQQQPDLFTMSLSPLLPDVEALCLTNSTSTTTEIITTRSPSSSIKEDNVGISEPFLLYSNNL